MWNSRAHLVSAALLASVAWSGAARSQTAQTAAQGFALERFYPSPPYWRRELAAEHKVA